jgi:hypothetical protein
MPKFMYLVIRPSSRWNSTGASQAAVSNGSIRAIAPAYGAIHHVGDTAVSSFCTMKLPPFLVL